MPSNVLKLAIIGGDLRQKKLAELLANERFKVKTFGLSFTDERVMSNLKKCSDYKRALFDSDVVISGIPLSKDGVTVNTPELEATQSINLRDMFIKMNEYGCNMLIAGVISQKAKNLADEYGIRVVDLLDLDEMAVLNAIPAALHKKIIAYHLTVHLNQEILLGFFERWMGGAKTSLNFVILRWFLPKNLFKHYRV